jgi:hypothetical protein
MEPIERVLGCGLPITENVAFEVFLLLTEYDDGQGSYDRLELHVLRIGQDLVRRAGLTSAPIGVVVREVLTAEQVKHVPSERLVMSDGIARTASSLPTTDRLGELHPISESLSTDELDDDEG